MLFCLGVASLLKCCTSVDALLSLYVHRRVIGLCCRPRAGVNRVRGLLLPNDAGMFRRATGPVPSYSE